MDFSQRKLPKAAADKLKLCAIDSIRPGTLMLAPVYTFMKLNEKFVSVKAPLDFFTAQELERFKAMEFFYVPEFVETVQPFVMAARSVASLLSWKPEQNWKTDSVNETVLAPASYEIADAVLRIVGPLWSAAGEIEPFFVSIFADELCGPMPEALLVSARERSVDAYESAIFGSSWAVFLALHLGYCELAFLSNLRESVFGEIAQGKTPANEFVPVKELLKAANETLDPRQAWTVRTDSFAKRMDRASQKIRTRLNRVKECGLLVEGSKPATVFGEKGFVDV